MRHAPLVLALLVTLALAPGAWARCQQTPACAGGLCWIYLLTEESFDEECPGTGWEDEQRFTNSECGSSSTFAMLDTAGGYTDTDHFFQDFYVPGDTGDYADLELSISLAGIGPTSWWDIAEVWVSDAVSGQTIHRFQIHTNETQQGVCRGVSYDISGNHRGKWLRLTFNGNIFQGDVEYHIHQVEVFLINS